jgi:hypothetical protein
MHDEITKDYLRESDQEPLPIQDFFLCWGLPAMLKKDTCLQIFFAEQDGSHTSLQD